MSTWRTAVLPVLGLFFFLISHSQIMHWYPPWIQSTWNRWAAPGDREIVFALSGAPFWQGAHPDCKCTRGARKKRNKTQSLKSLSRHWLIHICLALCLTNKILHESRINTTGSVSCEGSQFTDKSRPNWPVLQRINLVLMKCQPKNCGLWELGIIVTIYLLPHHFCKTFIH